MILSSDEKRRIVSALNVRYRTTLDVDIVEVAVMYGFTSWPALLEDVQNTGTVDAGSSVGITGVDPAR